MLLLSRLINFFICDIIGSIENLAEVVIMVNTDTIKFIYLLKSLSSKSEKGFFPFSKTNSKPDKGGILYDDLTKFSDGHPIIADCLVDELHHDVISTYSSLYEEQGIIMRVNFDEDNGNAFVKITSKNNQDFCLIIEDGKWHCV